MRYGDRWAWQRARAEGRMSFDAKEETKTGQSFREGGRCEEERESLRCAREGFEARNARRKERETAISSLSLSHRASPR